MTPKTRTESGDDFCAAMQVKNGIYVGKREREESKP